MRTMSYVIIAGLSSLALAGAAQAADSLSHKGPRPEASAIGETTSIRLNAPVAATGEFAGLGQKPGTPAGSASLVQSSQADGIKLNQPSDFNTSFGSSLMGTQTAQSIGAGTSNSISSARLSSANELNAEKPGNGGMNSAILGLQAVSVDKTGNAPLTANNLTLGK